jgi:hypothetical protein
MVVVSCKNLIFSLQITPAISHLLAQIFENENENKCLDFDFDLNQRCNWRGSRLIHVAAKHNDAQLIENLFLKYGCDLYVKDDNQFRAIDIAILYVKYDSLQCLLKFDAYNSKADYSQLQAIHFNLITLHSYIECSEQFFKQYESVLALKKSAISKVLHEHKLPLHTFVGMINDYAFGG